jgi:hypothetical protein
VWERVVPLAYQQIKPQVAPIIAFIANHFGVSLLNEGVFLSNRLHS